ncbi:hypothetical protein JHD46_03500 [Sulfurimonas sp. SAG-AH-194-C20]|nr:hypothetical protein [Sulfurimonas sp. SAG-AH-194-C20]MDF1878701.1 hypothetical protein [Sulfurimonas sp. SAG-AH-194-C20]
MRLGFRLKHHFFSAFREFFVHHHGSLEFRAKIFALVIAANDKPPVESYIVVKDIGMNIYNGDEERSDLLMLSTKELIQKGKDNGFDIDLLVNSILKELKIIPRYAKKIDIKALRPLILLSHDQDTISYQENILEFLQNTKEEILNKQIIEV